jgi:hypothetical protein
METVVKKGVTPAPTRNSGLGMTMHGKVIQELQRLNLGARPNLTPVFQQKHKRWMIAGEEGGGCNGELGHYIGFVGVVTAPLAISIPIQSLIPNSTQRRVISQEMVRAQLFRYGSSCDLLITHHYLSPASKEGARPPMERQVLFLGKNGILAPETKQPVFFDHSGEAIDFPHNLIPLIQAVSKGAMTPKNNRAHCIPLQPINLGLVKKAKVRTEPVVEGEPIIDDSLLIAATPSAPISGKGAKRNKSTTLQIVEPQQTVAPVEVAALLAH